jgi:hypothetical protein
MLSAHYSKYKQLHLDWIDNNRERHNEIVRTYKRRNADIIAEKNRKVYLFKKECRIFRNILIEDN